MITYMRFWMSLKFDPIQPLVFMVTDRVMMGKTVSAVFHPFLFILAGNDDMHESSDEFEFRPDWTTDCGVSCPWTSEKLLYNVVNTLGPTFSIESSSFLQVRRTTNKSRRVYEFRPDRTKGWGVTALERCQKLVFAQYIENGSTEFDQILYTHYHWQDLYCYSKASFFANLQELQPLIDVRYWFLLNILRMDGQNLTKFCIHFIIDKIYVCIVKGHFIQIFLRVTALIDVRNCFCSISWEWIDRS